MCFTLFIWIISFICPNHQKTKQPIYFKAIKNTAFKILLLTTINHNWLNKFAVTIGQIVIQKN